MKKTYLATRVILFLLLAGIITSCEKQTSEAEDNSGYNAQKIDVAFSQAAQIGNIKSLVVSYNGSIIKEQYWKTGGANNQHDVRSVTKSVVGLLIGIAIEKGFIKSVDEPISNYLNDIAENFPADKSSITIKHLLTMSGGFQWDELSAVSGYNNWFNAANQVQYILNTPLSSQPGQTFTYNSAGIHLLSVIITQATKLSTQKFAEQYLFTPLGIGVRNWQQDKQGFYNGGAGLQITPNDMIKIGELIRNKGEYNGKRIVSSDWIEQATHSKIGTGNIMSFSSGYGYCWWTGQAGNLSYAYANGWGGQFIVVVPNLNLVVTATNQWSGVATTTANSQWYSTLSIIMNQIIPSFE